MTDQALQQVFGAGWNDVTSSIAGCTSAFATAGMLVVILRATNASDADAGFPDLQQNIKAFRDTIPRAPDAYLLLVVPQLDEDEYGLLRRALDNTLVCRKVLIPLDGADLPAAVRRYFPIVDWNMPIAPDQRTHATGAGDPNDEDLELLDRNGAMNIAQTLIDRFRP
jgi:hypothetical protein